MNKVRRICFYSGPGVGKSTTVAWLFAELKMLHHKVELAKEFIKDWTYINRQARIDSFEQVFIFGSQLHLEELPLLGGVDFVLCDAPLVLNSFYSKFLGCPAWQDQLEICKKWDEIYQPLNIVLQRERKEEEYQGVGRFQTFEEAKQLDNDILTFVNGFYQSDKPKVIQYDDRVALKEYILNNI